MIDFSDIETACERLRPLITHTPLLENLALNRQLGGRLLLKAESLQKTGSFKIRGAGNRLGAMSAEEKKRGVVAWSSGNHAQGVALAAHYFGIKALIVMPEDAPQAKIDGTKAYGAEVVLYDRFQQSREEIGAEIAASRGAIIVPPFDDEYIMAGQGSVGVEAYAQARDLDAVVDYFIVPTSGGGLAAGCATALAKLSPHTKILVSEPEGFDDMGRSLEAGERLCNDPTARSICDALLLPQPGMLTFPILQKYGVRGLSVEDEVVREAMGVAFEAFHLVLEPGGAAALAAVLAGKINLEGKTAVIVASGGNVDMAQFTTLLAR